MTMNVADTGGQESTQLAARLSKLERRYRRLAIGFVIALGFAAGALGYCASLLIGMQSQITTGQITITGDGPNSVLLMRADGITMKAPSKTMKIQTGELTFERKNRYRGHYTSSGMWLETPDRKTHVSMSVGSGLSMWSKTHKVALTTNINGLTIHSTDLKRSATLSVHKQGTQLSLAEKTKQGGGVLSINARPKSASIMLEYYAPGKLLPSSTVNLLASPIHGTIRARSKTGVQTLNCQHPDCK